MRKLYLDNIKWITVAIVVLYHVIYIYNGVEVYGIVGPFKEIQYQDVFQYLVYPWFMLILFVISGMNSRFYLNNHSHKEFVKTRTVKCLVPSTLGLLAFGWALGYYNLQLSNAYEQMTAVPGPFVYFIMCISGCGPLWYIQMLWLFSVILVFVRKVEKDRLYKRCSKVQVPIIVSFVLLIWGSANILNTPIVTVYRFGIYGMGFLLGYFVFSHDEVMDRLASWWIPLCALGIASCIAFVIMYWRQPFAEQSVLGTFLCNAYAWFGLLAIMSLAKRWGDFSNKFTEFMVKKSWGLYLFHYLPLAMCAYYLSRYAQGMPVFIHYLLTGVSAFAGAYILYEVISRIPVYRWLVCGISSRRP